MHSCFVAYYTSYLHTTHSYIAQHILYMCIVHTLHANRPWLAQVGVREVGWEREREEGWNSQHPTQPSTETAGQSPPPPPPQPARGTKIERHRKTGYHPLPPPLPLLPTQHSTYVCMCRSHHSSGSPPPSSLP